MRIERVKINPARFNPRVQICDNQIDPVVIHSHLRNEPSITVFVEQDGYQTRLTLTAAELEKMMGQHQKFMAER